MEITRKISFNLDHKTEAQLLWLLNDYNRNTISEVTISDIIRLAINNQFSSTNLQHVDENEEQYCEEKWLKNYESNL